MNIITSIVMALVLLAQATPAPPDRQFKSEFDAAMGALKTQDFTKAIEGFKHALARARAIGYLEGVANALRNEGIAANSLNRTGDALTLYQQALPVFVRVGDKDGEGSDYLDIANAERDLGRYSPALDAIRRATALHQDVGNHSAMADDANTLGTIEFQIGRYADALRSHQRALALFQRFGNMSGSAASLSNIGNVQTTTGEYQEALQSYHEALGIYQKIPDRLGQALAINDIGVVDENLGLNPDALQSFQQALAIDTLLGDADGKAADLSNVGVIEMQMGRDADALSAYQRAITFSRQAQDPDGEAFDEMTVCIAEEDQGRFNAALQSCGQALALYERVGDRGGEADTLSYLADVESHAGQYARAIRTAHEGLLLDEQQGKPNWQGLAVAAKSESKIGAVSDALRDYDAAVNNIERLRADISHTAPTVNARNSFFATTIYVYDQYIQYLLELNRELPGKGYDRKAFDMLERKEARALLEQIAGSTAQRFQGVPAEVIAQDKATQDVVDAALQQLTNSYAIGTSAVAAAQATLNSATAQRKAFERGVRAQYPAYYALLHPEPISLDDLQKHVLGADEAILAYNVLEDKSVLFVVTREQLATVSLAGKAALANTVVQVSEHIDSMLKSLESGILPDRALSAEAAADLPGFAADSYSLYQQLLPASIVPLIAGRKLIIVPSGPLFAVPWEALVTQEPAAEPHYLIEDHAISYIPSGSLLALVRETSYGKTQRAPLLAFANPAFGSGGAGTSRGAFADLQYGALRDDAGGAFPALPGTAVEANGVRDALRAGPDSIISGEDATKARLLSLNDSHQLAQYRYVLFATHAVLPNEVKGVDQPALVLAHPYQDGFVTMADVFGLTLNADFVALSACNTGQGARDAGDGISGMTRAFLYAGTPAISVTLWSVDDKAAAQITPAFFAAMSAGTSSAEALRQAKLAMLHSSDPRFRHPYAWAPTVIFGDGDRSNANSGQAADQSR